MPAMLHEAPLQFHVPNFALLLCDESKTNVLEKKKKRQNVCSVLILMLHWGLKRSRRHKSQFVKYASKWLEVTKKLNY